MTKSIAALQDCKSGPDQGNALVGIGPVQKCIAHYGDVIMGAITSQISCLAIVYSTIYSDADKKTSKLRVTGLCVGNSPGTGEFPAQMASDAENVSIWWRHPGIKPSGRYYPEMRVKYHCYYRRMPYDAINPITPTRQSLCNRPDVTGASIQ